MSYDVLIKNSLIIDGTGKPRYEGDIGIIGEYIADIGCLHGDAKQVIDAKGKMVSPGFIDAHSHSDYLLAMDFSASNLLEQGVTMEICGPCGESAVPCYDGYYNNYKSMMPTDTLEFLYQVHGSIKTFMQYVTGRRLATNVGMMIGNGTVRGKVMGLSDAPPTAHQMQEMRALIREAMEQGFLGLSSGLCYPPSCFASKDELIELCNVVAEFGGVYSSHVRSESDDLIPAVNEAVYIAEHSGITLVLSHHKVIGARNIKKSVETLAIVDAANALGRRVFLDQYPYLSGCANLLDAIPPKYRTQGWPTLKELLKDTGFRKQLQSEIEGTSTDFENFLGNAGYIGTSILLCPSDTSCVGKSITEIAVSRNETPFEAFINILIEHDANILAAYAFTSDWDMYHIMAHPNAMVGSDMYRSYTEHDEQEAGHPRETATFVRYLRLVRDNGICSLEEIIHRMTGLPASVYSLVNRGHIQKGFFADICIFDYSALMDRADYAHAYRKNDGIDTVLVNGSVVVENGRINGVKNGVFVKKAKN